MKKKITRATLLIVIMVLIFTIVGFEIGKKKSTIHAFVAKYDIPQRTNISEDLLEEIDIPYYNTQNNAYFNKEDILNKYVKTNSYIPKGSLFYKGFLDDADDMNDILHMQLQEDEATYDIFINDVVVNPGNIKKGMFVNLYLTVKDNRYESDLLFGNIEIIGLYDSDYKEIKQTNYNKMNCISLKVKKDMVPYLNKAIKVGEVSLIVDGNVYKEGNPYINLKSKVFCYIQ